MKASYSQIEESPRNLMKGLDATRLILAFVGLKMSDNLVALAALGALGLLRRNLRTLDVQECAIKLCADVRRIQEKEKLRSLKHITHKAVRRTLQHWNLQVKLKPLQACVHKLKVLASKLLREKKANEATKVSAIEIKDFRGSLPSLSEVEVRAESKIPLPKDCNEKELEPYERARTPMHEIENLQATPFKKPSHKSSDFAQKNTPRRLTRPQGQENQQPRGRESTRRGRQLKDLSGRASSVPLKCDDSLFNKIRADLTERAKGKGLTKDNATEDFGTRLFNRASEIENKRQQLRLSYEPEFSFAPRLAINTDKWLSNRASKDFKSISATEEVAVVSSVAVIGLSNLQSDYGA